MPSIFISVLRPLKPENIWHNSSYGDLEIVWEEKRATSTQHPALQSSITNFQSPTGSTILRIISIVFSMAWGFQLGVLALPELPPLCQWHGHWAAPPVANWPLGDPLPPSTGHWGTPPARLGTGGLLPSQPAARDILTQEGWKPLLYGISIVQSCSFPSI